MKTNRRFFLSGSAAALWFASSSNGVSATEIPFAEFDPASAMNGNYYRIASTLAKPKDIENIVSRFWGLYRKKKYLPLANAAILWTFLLWRATPLGERRIRVSLLGRKMGKQLQKDFPGTVDGYSWDATFMGMEGLSRGVLDTLNIVPEFLEVLDRSIDMDESYFYGMGLMLMAKMYLKLPRFPVSKGDPKKALVYLERARPYQEKKYAFFYNVLAEAELLSGNREKALEILSTFEDKVEVSTKAERFTLDLAIHDAALFKKVIQDGTYDQYLFDPFLQPIDDFRGFVLSQRRN